MSGDVSLHRYQELLTRNWKNVESKMGATSALRHVLPYEIISFPALRKAVFLTPLLSQMRKGSATTTQENGIGWT